MGEEQDFSLPYCQVEYWTHRRSEKQTSEQSPSYPAGTSSSPEFGVSVPGQAMGRVEEGGQAPAALGAESSSCWSAGDTLRAAFPHQLLLLRLGSQLELCPGASGKQTAAHVGSGEEPRSTPREGTGAMPFAFLEDSNLVLPGKSSTWKDIPETGALHPSLCVVR